MNYINPPTEYPANITHKTFYSQLYSHELGYNIYLPPEYETSGKNYPVHYHLHGWTGNESSEIGTMEPRYANEPSIVVFPNSSPVIEAREYLPVEAMLLTELMPHIEGKYRTDTAGESRWISGFSMGGGAAFYYAAKYPELFRGVTAYAGTYHHYYHKGYRGVGEAPDKAPQLYQEMMQEQRHLEENNVLSVIRRNAGNIRGKLDIRLHIGTADILFCDNEIMHLYLNDLNIPHTYTVFEEAGHELAKIL